MENLVNVGTVEPDKTSISNNITLKILTGEAARRQISEKKFIVDWGRLYKNCPWATVYQSWEFVHLWYRIYSHNLPILIIGLREEDLVGLLPLFQEGTRKLMGAGSNQAEYQTWISTPEVSDRFIQDALNAIRKQFPGYNLHLKYLPQRTPLSWVTNDGFWKNYLWVQSVRHPIMKIDRDILDAELRKKNKREKINRLKRQGELRFERISDHAEFSGVFDQLALQNDFRKGAVYNAGYYHENPQAKDFLLSLFEHKLLHATVLKVNDEIIASNVGPISGNWVHLQGINTHSPAHAKHSPGILHFLMLGQLMADEGYEVFDLTPGDDPYKDTLATEHITSYKLTFGNYSSLKRAKLKNGIAGLIKTYLPKVGISRQKQRITKNEVSLTMEKMKILKKHGSFSMLLNSVRSFGETRSAKTFAIHYGTDSEKKTATVIASNYLGDLLDFEPGGTLLTKREFLADAMKRLEAGQEFYSMKQGSRLVCCIWKEYEAGRKVSKQVPGGRDEPWLLTNLYFHPLGENLVKKFLNKVVEEIFGENVSTTSVAGLRTNNRRVARVLDKLGYSQQMNTQ